VTPRERKLAQALEQLVLMCERWHGGKGLTGERAYKDAKALIDIEGVPVDEVEQNALRTTETILGIFRAEETRLTPESRARIDGLIRHQVELQLVRDNKR
jgi:hypothetical protein